ncbi:MAG: outer membrane receptor protein involved in Fe transport [Myxococcota bacterium]
MAIWLAAAVAQDLPMEEIVVEDDAVVPRDEAVELVLEGEAGARVPGVQGDALKAVQVLGGVGRSAAGSDGLVIWGAAPQDTRLYIDDIPVPRLFHRGGVRSILPSSAVDRVTVVPGGAGARYGRGLGGVVQVTTAAPGDAPWGGAVGVDPIDAAASVQVRPGERTGVAVGGRVGLLRHTLGAVAPDSASTLVPVPAFWDAQVRVVHELPNGDELAVLGLAVDDQVERGIPSLNPDDRFTEATRTSFGRLGVRIQRFEGDVVTLTSGWVGFDRTDQRLAFGDVSVSDEADIGAAGLLLSQARRLTDAVEVTLGLDGQLRSTRTVRDGAVSLPAREGDVVVFGQPPGDRVNQDAWTVRQAEVGSFVAAALQPVVNVSVEPGLRFEPTMIDGDRVLPVRPTEPPVGYTELSVFIDPRLQLAYTPGTSRIYAAAARVHQPPSAADLSPVFGSPVLPPARAWQALAGVALRPVRGLTSELVVFGAQQRALAVRPVTATPPVAGALVSRGEGRSGGVQAVVAASMEPVEARLAYTWSRAERRSTPQDRWRLSDDDQTHGLQAVAGWVRRRWELGARLELTSGFPRTAVVGALFDTRSQSYDPLFGPHNRDRLPLFLSVAARAAWEVPIGHGQLRVWLDVLNATDRVNAEEVVYSADYTRRGVVQGLPVLPTLGVEVSR